MARFHIILFILLLQSLHVLGQHHYAELSKLSPDFMLVNFSGFCSSSQKLNGFQKENGWGIYSIGIPTYTPSFKIRQKFFIGGSLGVEVGAGFPPGNIAVLLKIPLGFSAGYKINEDAFVSARYHLLVQTGIFLQGSSDDGWSYAGTVRYKNLMLDFCKNIGGDIKENGFLKGRMKYNYIQLFPKYLFKFKKYDNVFWLGLRYETFRDSGREPNALNRATNTEILFGKIISFAK